MVDTISKSIAEEIASKLLEVEAVFLRPNDMFTWSSGIKSPIYCDNRITLSYPEIRNLIRDSLINLIQENFAGVELVAGVATAGIPHAALVADKMSLPMVYVRSKSKDHGRQNQIEGKLEPGTKVVVVEDLISTGGSSLDAVAALREAGAEVMGLVAIFSYGLNKATDNFKAAQVEYYSLSNYDVLIDVALKQKRIQESDLEILRSWQASL